MKNVKVSMILFYDLNGNILLQNRKSISKFGEEFGFFGGSIEGNETPNEALKREIKEELTIDLKEFKLFKNYRQIIKELNMNVERWVFLSSMPDLKKLKVNEGRPALMKFEDSFNLKMVPGDIEILREIYEFLRKPNTF